MKQELKHFQRLTEHEERVWCICWSKDGETLASCGSDQKVILWKKKSNISNEWAPFQIIENAHQRTIRRVDFSPNGKYIAVASFDSTASIWEEDENGVFKPYAVLEGHENELKSVSWDNAGLLLATCSRDKNVWIWEMEGDNEFECVSVCTGHTQDVKNVKWHPNRELLFSSSYDDTIKIWREEDDDWFCVSTLTEHNRTVWDIAFNNTGTKLISVSGDKKMVIWEIADPNFENVSVWKPIQILENCHEREIYSVDWSLNNIIVTGSGDDSICLWHMNNETQKFELLQRITKAHNNDVNSVSWNPKDPNLLASCGDDNIIYLWSLEKTE